MNTCPHCGVRHIGVCPWVKAIEYYPDGTVKRVEFHQMQQVETGETKIIRVPDAPSSVTGNGYVSPDAT